MTQSMHSQSSAGQSEKRSLKVWLCDLTYSQQTIASDTMPMAIGCLSTFAERNLTWLPPHTAVQMS